MGGFAGAIKDLIQDPVVKTQAETAFKKAFRPMENFFQETEIGKSLGNDLKDYHMQKSKNLQGLIDQENLKPEHLREKSEVLQQQSARLASDQTFGKNHARISAHIKAAHMKYGPTYSSTMQDHVSMFLKDTTDIDALSESQKIAKYKFGAKLKDENVAKQSVSLSKLNYLNNKETPNIGHNINPVYNKPGKGEKALHDYINVIAAPFIAIPHLGTVFNNTLSGGLPEMASALSELIPGTNSYKKWHDTLATTGIFADTSFRAYTDLQKYKSGVIADITHPTVGYWLNKVIHQPGFNAIRDWQLCFTGTVAKMEAEKHARDFVASGSKKAEIELRDTMGLSLQEIKSQKGQLRPDQIERAIYNYVDKKIFLNTALRRSYYSGSSAIMRTALMYHGYVAAQGQLMRKEFQKAWELKGSNPMVMAQFLTTAGIVFPVVGEGLKQLEQIGRGQGTNLKEDVDDFKKGGWSSAYTYADAMSHMAGFGVAAGYAQSATRNALVNTFVGPLGNMVGSIGDHTAHPIWAATHQKKDGSDRKVDLKPLARDVLQDTLPDNTGKIASHVFLPTNKEKSESHPKSSMKLKSLKLKKLTNAPPL